MLDHLKTDKGIENDDDFIGGGLLDSGVYDFVVDMAYFDKSQGGANSLTLHLKTAKGQSMRTTLWITSGTAKGGHNYYEDKKTGKRRYLPGFNQANAICMLGINKEIADVIVEDKTIKVYDFDEKKEMPKSKEVLTELLGAQITCGIVLQTVDKNVKNAQGVYVPSGDTRDENEIDKCFRTSDGMTVAELRGDETEPAFKEKWLAKNEGVTRMKAKGAKAATQTGAPASTGGAPETASIFNE